MSEELPAVEADAGRPADTDALLEDPLGQPRNEIPATVAFDTELLATDGYAVFCAGLHVYSTGFRLHLELRARDRPRRPLYEVFHRAGPDEMLIGIEFADGRRGRHRGWDSRHREPGGGVMVHYRGGGGDERAVGADFFVTPLPPPGPARIICAWPARGIGDTVTELPVDAMTDAAGRIRALWPPQRPDDERLPERESTVPGDSWFAR
ncbi:hypothetical protein [Nocardioides sp. YIM 152315]|uniref:hypothetical protein n=1 Tax=Nocardioides sp. YIM 152315 TaxID=3031760 RepID=UPI0023DB452E|nr:hypothetical protein [Nocardioides sp. YIM 152315]MDF1604208.1 hypothetical protein [Nocardioides sp. YIM 152315]